MYFNIYWLTIIPLVVCGVPSLRDVSKVTNCPDCETFPSGDSNENFTDFTFVLRKEDTPTVLVGARDFVLQLTMDGELVHDVSIPSRQEDIACSTWKQTVCSNTIDTIIEQKKTGLIFACSARAALCWKANETQVVGKPERNVFYAQKPRQAVVSDPYIFQGFPDVQESHGKLLKANINTEREELSLQMLDVDPKFISVYEFGNFIYYFFIDISDEIIDRQSRVPFARVGRLCKHDSGGDKRSPVRDRFTTFSKARLLCSSTSNGEEKLRYNNLERTSYTIGDDGEVYIYGFFRALEPVDEMFAICRYSLSEIEKVFSDKKYYEIVQSSVKVVTAGKNDARHFKCDSSLDTSVVSKRQFDESKRRAIHVASVSPDGGKPVVVNNYVRISHMLADSVTLANKSYDILRLFDSNMIYEIFLPINLLHGVDANTYFSVRKISEEPLDVSDVTKMKFNGVPPSHTSTPVSPISTTSAVNKFDVTTTTKPSSTRIPTTANYDSSLTATFSSPTISNLTKSTNITMLGNVSSPGNAAKPSFSDLPIGNSLATSSLPANPGNVATLQPSATSPSPSRTRNRMKSSDYLSKSDDWGRFRGQEKMIVAAKEVVLFVPVASCGVYTTCRDCIAAMNPYCAWYGGNCVQLRSTENRKYIQDLSGNYSKVCPPVDVSCDLVQVSNLIPNAVLFLQCTSSGLPAPVVSSWSKDGNSLSAVLNQSVTVDGTQLKIQRYTLLTAGKYTCRVDNGVTSNSCSIEIPGSRPQIHCKVSKSKKEFWLACNATGYPQPKLVLESESNKTGRTKVLIKKGQRYQPVAYNAFGASNTAGVYEIFSTEFEFEMKDATWSEELSNTDSSEYKALKNKVVNAVEELYKDNVLFKYVSSVTFRKGSVVATLVLNGLKTPKSDESKLTSELQNAVEVKGQIGDLNVAVYDGKSDVPDQESSTAPPATRPPETDTRETEAQSSSSSGVPVWLLILLLFLIGALVFFVGYFCGLRGLVCSKLSGWQRRGTKDSSGSEEDGAEMKSRSRSEKIRESERMLLQKDEGKKQRSPVKKSNHELTNNVSKHGSIEIKQTDNSGEERRPVSEHSTC